MKKKLTYIILIILYSHNLLVAQSIENDKESKNLIFIEAGGFGGYGSINYEHLVKKINKFKFSTRIGLSTYHLNDFTNRFNPDIIIPISINVYYGTQHNIDFGLGQTITNIVYANNIDYQPTRINNFNTNLSIGYRYQKETNGIVFKIAYSPVIENNKMFRHWFLLSFGYSF